MVRELEIQVELMKVVMVGEMVREMQVRVIMLMLIVLMVREIIVHLLTGDVQGSAGEGQSSMEDDTQGGNDLQRAYVDGLASQEDDEYMECV